MAGDRVSELYLGEPGALFEPQVRQACRERVHWICSQARGDDVLDVGCSQGICSIILGREGRRVQGVDIDPETVAYARRALENEPESVQKNVDFRLIAPGKLPYDDGVFDSVLLGEVIEHLTRPDGMLEEMRRVLRPDGVAVITTPFGLHRDVGHVRTYYLSNFLETVGRFFEQTQLTILHKYICFCGTPRPEIVEPRQAEIDARALLRDAERAMYAAEENYVERADRLRRQHDHLVKESQNNARKLQQADVELQAVRQALEEWKTGSLQSLRLLADKAGDGEETTRLKGVAEVFANQLKLLKPKGEIAPVIRDTLARCVEFQRRLSEAYAVAADVRQAEAASLRQEVDREKAAVVKAQQDARNLSARIQRQVEQIEYFKSVANLKYEEVRYRVGDAIVRAATSPIDFMMLPGRMARLCMDGIHRRRERGRLGAGKTYYATAVAAAPASSAGAKPQAGAASKAAAEPAVKFNAVDIPADRTPRLPIKMAAIMDEFTLACFKPECQVISVKPDDWKRLLTEQKPDFLFVESAWSGVDGAWRHRVARSRPITDGPLFELVEWCKQRKIPTVFWNKEDPPNFEHFIHAAALFDHVFTTDENCIPIYRARLKHERVYALPFAAQGLVHNPLGSRKNLVGDVCFAGAYYAKRHKERQQDLDILLAPAMKRGLHIYDRMHGTDNERYMFPEQYRSAIRGGLSYAEMLDAYKRYKVFLNVNSVIDSPTMFSRRVLELLACGTPVVSTHALGIERLLGKECVPLVRTEEEVVQWLDMLLKNTEMADRMVLKGQRRIFGEHTYAHRLREVLAKIGVDCPAPQRRVSIITCTNRPAKLEQIIENYERQNYPDKEFLLVLNSDDYSLDAVKKRLDTVENARAFQLPEKCTLGECLNLAISEMHHDYWSKFDDDNFYGDNFITDLMLPFEYTEASVIGKYTYYAFMEGANCLALRYPGCEHQYVSLLSGSALIVDRKVMGEVQFPEKNRGEDTQFLRECVSRGFKLYSADRFNYVVRRSPRIEDHTWQITQDEFMRHCEVVAYIDDFKNHVSV